MGTLPESSEPIPPRRLVVIGAGVAGMTAAIHARSSGFEVDVFERHTVAGGLCTSWKIDGFLFDGCVEFFIGSGPSSPFYPLWREVGVVPRHFVDRSIYAETTFGSGDPVLLHADPDRLQAHFDAVSPADRRVTARLAGLVRLMRVARYRVDRASELRSWGERLREVTTALPTMRLWRDGFATPIREFAQQFESPRLRAAVLHALPPDLPLLSLVQVLGDLANGAAGCPLGGSLAVAQSMARRCRDLGVRLHLGVEVERIDVEGAEVTGVTTAAGHVAASAVVAAGDLRTTLDRLLGARFPSPVHEEPFGRPLVPSVCIVSCGLRQPLPQAADAVVHRHVFDAPVEVAGHRVAALGWKTYQHDLSVAPPPRTVVEINVESDWAPWAALAEDRVGYDAARTAFGEGIVGLMDRAVAGFRAAVQTVDVATPVTVERYTHNYQGHYMTFMPERGRPPRSLPRTIRGLRGLYLAGMWVEPPGGLPNALRSGRAAAEVLCHDLGIRFVPAAPSVEPR